jgi:hypothetical protein
MTVNDKKKESPLRGILDRSMAINMNDAADTLRRMGGEKPAGERQVQPVTVKKGEPKKEAVSSARKTPATATTPPPAAEPSDRQTVLPEKPQTVAQKDGQTVAPSEIETRIPSDGQTPPQPRPLSVLGLAYNQAAILEYLIAIAPAKGPGFVTYRMIMEATNITQSSARDVLRRLHQRGFISKPLTYRTTGTTGFQGLSYVPNRELCDALTRIGGLEMNRYPAVPQTIPQTIPQTVRLSDQFQPPSSSSFKNTTATETPDPDQGGQTVRRSEPEILAGPELAYWLDVGLQEPQAREWCREFGIDPEHLSQQLAWARWDMVENGQAKGKESVLNWVYKTLKKTGGCWPRPGNYQSPEEKRLGELQAETRRRREARQQLQVAELELQFEEILDDPAGEEYRSLLDTVHVSQRGSKLIETVLRQEFFRRAGFDEAPARQ